MATPARLKMVNGTSKKTSATLYGNLNEPYPIVTEQFGNYQFMGPTKLFDCSGGAATASVGYKNERVTVAMINQLHKFSVSNELAFRSEISEEFSQALIDTTEGHMARVFVPSSGQCHSDRSQ